MSRFVDINLVEKQLKNFTSLFFDEIQKHLDNVPTADVKPVLRGRWEEDRDCGSLRCSNCGHCTDEMLDICEEKGGELAKVIGSDEHDIMFVLKHPYFCSKCGADMRGDKE